MAPDEYGKTVIGALTAKEIRGRPIVLIDDAAAATESVRDLLQARRAPRA